MNNVAGLDFEKVDDFLPPCERRYFPRHCTRTTVSCRAFTSDIPESGIEGNVINFSDDGFYMETRRKYPVDSTLFIRVTRYSKKKASDRIGPKSLCLAQVRWRCEVNDQHAVRYGMGLRYIK